MLEEKYKFKSSEAKAFADEIALADTPEKFDELEKRYAVIAEKLDKASLPKWKSKLAALMKNQKAVANPSNILNAG